jgi:hypothetical protein
MSTPRNAVAGPSKEPTTPAGQATGSAKLPAWMMHANSIPVSFGEPDGPKLMDNLTTLAQLNALLRNLRFWLDRNKSSEGTMIASFLQCEIDLNSGPAGASGNIDWNEGRVKSISSVSSYYFSLVLADIHL